MLRVDVRWGEGRWGRGAGVRERRQALGGGSVVAPMANLVQTPAAAAAAAAASRSSYTIKSSFPY